MPTRRAWVSPLVLALAVLGAAAGPLPELKDRPREAAVVVEP